MSSGERLLTLGELANIWVDEPAAPFQIALVGVFDAGPFSRADGSIDTAGVRAELAGRARGVPALRRRVVSRQGLGRPMWTMDPRPSPERQIAVATLPPSQDILSWCAQEIVRPLDMAGPPWRAVVVDGLDGARFGLLLVVHHVLADGLTGVAIAGALLDPTAEGRGDEPAPLAPPSGPAPGGDDLVLATSAGRVLREVWGAPARLWHGWRQVTDAAKEFRTRAPVTSLSRPLGPERRLATVRQPLGELRSAGHRLGVTVNDLLLAAVTGGLRELLVGRGDVLPAGGLRASMPVGSRGAGQPDGILLVDLSVAESDPLRRLAQIRDDTTRLKARLHSGGGDVLDVLRLPLPAARLAVRWMRRIAGRRLNLFVTNVPGPAEPLWLAGARLLETYPVAPLVRGLSLDVAALSYAGALHVAVNADAAVTDLQVLAAGMQRSFAELREAARAGARLPAAPASDADRRGVVENTVVIERSPASVFAFVTDPRQEPAWNPQLLEVDQLTDGPVGVDTRFRMRFGSGVGDSTVTYTAFDPPHRWASTSTSRRLDVRFEGTIHPAGPGSRLVVRTRLLPHGPLRPLAPLLRRYLHWAWNRNLAAIKAELENHETGEDHASRGRVREPVRQHP